MCTVTVTDMMRQPCTVPLVDTIPFTLREKVVRAYARCITDLQIATADRKQVGGALGSEAEAFLRECTAVAEWKNQGVGDLAHWSSMTWGGHWRQRIGVEIARGVARCVERAATGGWASSGTGRGCSHEYDPDCG